MHIENFFIPGLPQEYRRQAVAQPSSSASSNPTAKIRQLELENRLEELRAHNRAMEARAAQRGPRKVDRNTRSEINRLQDQLAQATRDCLPRCGNNITRAKAMARKENRHLCERMVELANS